MAKEQTQAATPDEKPELGTFKHREGERKILNRTYTRLDENRFIETAFLEDGTVAIAINRTSEEEGREIQPLWVTPEMLGLLVNVLIQVAKIYEINAADRLMEVLERQPIRIQVAVLKEDK